MNFHNIRFPEDISYGSHGGPEFSTQITSLNNGYEERNALWAHGRRRYDAAVGVRNLNDLYIIQEFFQARMGRLYGFLWKDWSDYRSCPPQQSPTNFDQILGTGDNQTSDFYLTKSYSSGSYQYTRPIQKPVLQSVRLAMDGIEINQSDYNLFDHGLVRFNTPPPTNSLLTAGFEFDVPVRFNNERLEISLSAGQKGHIPSIEIIEIKLKTPN